MLTTRFGQGQERCEQGFLQVCRAEADQGSQPDLLTMEERTEIVQLPKYPISSPVPACASLAADHHRSRLSVGKQTAGAASIVSTILNSVTPRVFGFRLRRPALCM